MGVVTVRQPGVRPVFDVLIPTRFTIELDEAIEFVEPGDPDYDPDECYGEQPYDSWGVWDNSADDWADEDAKHFDTFDEAVAWLNAYIGPRVTGAQT